MANTENNDSWFKIKGMDKKSVGWTFWGSLGLFVLVGGYARWFFLLLLVASGIDWLYLRHKTKNQTIHSSDDKSN